MADSKLRCRVFKGLNGDKDAIAIRTAVFIEEQGFRIEFDDIDNIAVHTVLYVNDTAAATGRVYTENGEFIIGRVAVLKPFRKTGLGVQVLSVLEKEIIKLGGKQSVLSAQLQAREFYERNGYKATGEVYYDEECPHIRMIKNL